MKYAQQLQQTQTPEWRGAYIDYKGLKKYINKIQGLTTAHSGRLVRPMSDLYVNVDISAAVGKQPLAWDTQTQDFPTSSPTPFPPGLAITPSSVTIGSAPSTNKCHSTTENMTVTQPLSLHDTLSLLPLEYMGFFHYLDVQLEKVEAFFCARESELLARTEKIKEQARELQAHRAVWNGSASQPDWRTKLLQWSQPKPKIRPQDIIITLPDRSANPPSIQRRSTTKSKAAFPDGSTAEKLRDPSDYLIARKKLKKAVFEHYRVLEMLCNYRTQNYEGFRKMLKKFDKTIRKTLKITVGDTYINEKVLPSAFGSNASITRMKEEMEVLFAATFTDNNKKEAVRRLRAASLEKTYYSNAFRSGLCLGISLPLLVLGLHQSLRGHTPNADAILFTYAVLAMPMMLAVLIGVNLLVWTQYRINYVFIFSLNFRTKLSVWGYIEIVLFLFATLCFSFWFTFSELGPKSLRPEYYAVIWVAIVVGWMIFPLPLFSRPTRFWLLKSMGRLFVPGVFKVEFTDFWLGDQLCSFAFTLSNLYTVGYAYVHGFDHLWEPRAVAPEDWIVPFTLVSLPLLVRVIQSARRYCDSGLIMHVWNAGKYASAIFAHLTYYIWRYRSSEFRGVFAPWLIFAVLSSFYSSIWDVCVDWSLNPLNTTLGRELMYNGQKPRYWFAIATNTCIRFLWLAYLPKYGPSTQVRSFAIASLEMLRRWQWNFFRVENEHLGNMDQYRATREAPLPYRFPENENVEDEDYDSEQQRRPWRSWMPILYH